VSAHLYLEGGGDSKELHARCREGFRKLLERSSLQGRVPRLTACGGRDQAFRDFVRAQNAAARGDYIALLVDSEDPVADIEQTWAHLAQRDGWPRPSGACDEQVLLMVTCMETWLVADRGALRRHYGVQLQETALPPLPDLETRGRHLVQTALAKGTRGGYRKGAESFKLLGELDPEALAASLPSFARARRILKQRLPQARGPRPH
jgi:hypothetical protein